jgi:hypothetical protein
MNKEYSDTLYPCGIGTSFIITFLAIMLGGALTGIFILQDSFLQQSGGGIILLLIFSAVVAGPIFYNKRISRFEKDRTVIRKFDDIGAIQGLRGAFFRFVLYDDGLEIRAFYHRYFIPYDKIEAVSVENGYFSKKMTLATMLEGVPDCIVASDKQLLDIACFIENKIQPDRAAAAGSVQPTFNA